MTEITSDPNHGDDLIVGQKATRTFQTYLDDIKEKLNNFLLGEVVIFSSYTVATVPDATEYEDGAIIVSDETGGRTIATSDGLVWRRVSDGNIVS